MGNILLGGFWSLDEPELFCSVIPELLVSLFGLKNYLKKCNLEMSLK